MLQITWRSTDSRLTREIPDALLKAIKKATKEAASLTKDVAQQECPVDTGYLRSKIFYRAEGPLKYTIGADAHYAGYVEFGTRFMRAQPYMRPALIEVHMFWIKRIVREIEAELNRI